MDEQPNNETELSPESIKFIDAFRKILEEYRKQAIADREEINKLASANKEEDLKLAAASNNELNESLINSFKAEIKEIRNSCKIEIQDDRKRLTQNLEADHSKLTNINPPIVEEKPVVDIILILESVPNFSNLGGTILPPEFVEQIRTIDKLHSMEWGHWKLIFYKKLTDGALSFFQSRTEEFIGLEDFLTKFLNYFWSIERQLQLQKFITTCKYERNGSQSMVEFCRHVERLNSMLTGSLEIGTKDLIGILLDKLPFSIRMTMSCNEFDDYCSFEDSLLKLQITAEQKGYDKANRRIGYDKYSSQYCGCETQNSPNRQISHPRNTNDYCRDSERTGKFYSSNIHNIHVEQNVNTADRRHNTKTNLSHNLKLSHLSIKQCHQSSSTIQHSHPDHSHKRSEENDCVKVGRQQCRPSGCEEMGRRQSGSSNEAGNNNLEPKQSNCSKSLVIDLTSTENVDTSYISPISPQPTPNDGIVIDPTQIDTTSILQTTVSQNSSSLNPEATSFVPKDTATQIISKSSIFSFRLRPASPDVTMELSFNEASMSTAVVEEACHINQDDNTWSLDAELPFSRIKIANSSIELNNSVAASEVTHTNQDDTKWTMDNELPYSSIDEIETPVITDDHTPSSIPETSFVIIEDEEIIGPQQDEINWTMDDELPYCDHEVEGCLLIEEDHSCSPEAIAPPEDICNQIQELSIKSPEVDVCIHVPELDLSSVLVEEEEECSCSNIDLSPVFQFEEICDNDPCHDVIEEIASMSDTDQIYDLSQTDMHKQPDETSNQKRGEPFQTTVIDTVHAIFILLQNWLLVHRLQKRRLLPGEKLGWGLSPPRSRQHLDLPPGRPQSFKRCLFRQASSGSKKFYHRRPGRHKTSNGGNKVNYQPLMPRKTKPTQGRRFHLLWPHRYKGLIKCHGILSTNGKCKKQIDYNCRPHLRIHH